MDLYASHAEPGDVSIQRLLVQGVFLEVDDVLLRKPLVLGQR